MFFGCILIWYKLQEWGKAASDKASEISNANWANPIQAETNKDIKVMESAVKQVRVVWSKLPKPKSHYEMLALSHREELDTTGNMDEDVIFSHVEKLSAEELKALYYCFGVKDHTTVIGQAIFTGNLFRWYEKLLDDWGVKPTELQRMKSIWAKTKMWG